MNEKNLYSSKPRNKEKETPRKSLNNSIDIDKDKYNKIDEKLKRQNTKANIKLKSPNKIRRESEIKSNTEINNLRFENNFSENKRNSIKNVSNISVDNLEVEENKDVPGNSRSGSIGKMNIYIF